ncbi:MAG: hypothetical protein CM1200mP18_03610 [Gammaproteobacteria bacterium]|nr:MAG: hypothetical protein CM1200mP18_03610 [Gammaproteobacteria bacterium]
MSIIKTTLEREPRSRFTLVYGNRETGSIIFREALERLKNTYMDRLSMGSYVVAGESEFTAA